VHCKNRFSRARRDVDDAPASCGIVFAVARAYRLDGSLLVRAKKNGNDKPRAKERRATVRE